MPIEMSVNEELKTAERVEIDYVNYRGERAVRKIIPESIRFGATDWHKEPGWLLKAFDIEKNATREFAMKDIHAWQVR